MKMIKVLYDCEEDKAEVLTLEQFAEKFNRNEVSAFADLIVIIEDNTTQED